MPPRLSLLHAQGKVLAGGATFACLLMLKHLFLSLAPLYFVHLLGHYCFEGGTPARPRTETDIVPCGDGGSGAGSGGLGGVEGSKGSDSRTSAGETRSESRSVSCGRGGVVAQAAQPQGEQAARFLLKRLVSLGVVVVCVFLTSLGPQCVSDGWTTEACLRQLGQLAVRLFPFGRLVFPLGTLVVPARDVESYHRKVIQSVAEWLVPRVALL